MERTWLRWSLRRRWRSLAALALLIALATAGVTAAVAGADRARSALDRLTTATDGATLNILPNIPGFDWDAVAALPQVEELAVYWVSGAYVVDGDRRFGNTFFSPLDYEHIERPVALSGRLADPESVDEVVVTPTYARAHDIEVGDPLTISLFEPESVGPALAAFSSTGEVTEPDGPEITATVVGVVRSFWTALTENDYRSVFPEGAVFVSPALFDDHLPNLIGEGDTAGMAYANALVRLDGGDAAIPAFTEAFTELTGRSDIDMWVFSRNIASVQTSIDFEVSALMALALAAALASAILIGQAVARMSSADAAELAALVGAGISVRQRVVAVLLPLLVATAVGLALGAAGALVASAVFPIGTAALYEPTPGASVDVPVTIGVAAGAALLVASLSAVSTWIAAREARGVRGRRSAVARAAARGGLPVPVVMGTRFALERGVGSQAIPVAPALVAVVAGVVGLVGTLTFAHGLDDASRVPERWGQSWQLISGTGGNGVMFTDPGVLTDAYLQTPGVDAAAPSKNAVAAVGDHKLALWSFDSETASRLVLTDGRLPSSPDEILVGPTTLHALGAEIGDSLEITGPEGTMAVTVVGTSLTPEGSHSSYDNAGWARSDTYRTVFGEGFKQAGVLVWTQPGADLDTVIADLTAASVAATGSPLPPWAPEVPGKVAALERVGQLPMVLGVFLVVLAVGAVGHALSTAISRRARDIAVLRTLGMTPGGSRTIATTQALVIAVIGIVVGVPLGWALGRGVWRAVAQNTPVEYAEPFSALAFAVAVPATVALALLLAAPAGARAARMRVATTLRTE